MTKQREKRLYRVTAFYSVVGRPGEGEWSTVRHYQSRRAAEECAERWRNGYVVYAHTEEEHMVPSALRVTVDVSDPVTWPVPR